MKRLSIIIALFVAVITINAQNNGGLKKINNEAFKYGEFVKYSVYYRSLVTGKLYAGEASLEIKETPKVIGGRNTMHIVGLGKTNKFFNWFFKVTDRYETYLDEEALVPWIFIRRVNEGGYKLEQDIMFNHFTNKATDSKKNKVYDVIPGIQDLLSSYYYARTFDFTNSKKGDEFLVNVFLDWELYPMRIKITGRETIKTTIGSFKCVKFMPMLQVGNVFKAEEDLTFWVTDDKNKIVVLAEANILVGSVKIELMDYKNLANEISIVK